MSFISHTTSIIAMLHDSFVNSIVFLILTLIYRSLFVHKDHSQNFKNPKDPQKTVKIVAKFGTNFYKDAAIAAV